MNKTSKVRYTIISVFLLICWGLLLSPAVAQAEETGIELQPAVTATQFNSAWPMYMHDPQHSGRSDYRGPASPVQVKWSARMNGWVDVTSLGLGTNGDIYVNTASGNLNILDPRYGSSKAQFSAVMKGTPTVLDNGNVIATDGAKTLMAIKNTDLYAWRFIFDDKDYDQDLQTSPAVSTGELVFILAPDGQLFAINAETGKEEWKSEVYADNTPVADRNGILYTVSSAKRSEPGYLYAVKSNNGAVQWKLQLSTQDIDTCHLAVADDGTIFVAANDKIYAVTPAGELAWQVNVAKGLTAPAIGEDGSIYVGAEDGVFYAYNSDGTHKWQYKTANAIKLAPIINAVDGTVYMCSGEILYALNPLKGDVYFKYNAKQTITAGPIIDSKGILYIAAGNNVIALYSNAPYAPYQLSAETDRFNKVSLTWKQASGKDENGFIIEQRIDDLEYKKVGETTRDVTHFELTGLPAGLYTFRVKAFNDGGDSQYSNEVTVDLQATGNVSGDVRTARFYLNSTTYYQDSSPYIMDVAPTIIENRTFLPVRYVAEALGAEVEWLAAENKVNMVRGDKKVSLWINQPQAAVNGQLYFIDPQNHKVRPTLLPPGRTMLPIRFIAESLDCQVEWNEQTKEVKIVYEK